MPRLGLPVALFAALSILELATAPRALAAACTPQVLQQREVMREALSDVARRGLKGKHHFSITFLTTAKDVQVPDAQRERFPDRMSIILQHQFERLKVAPDKFEVVLFFKGKPARVVVPFNAVTHFDDPSINVRIVTDPASHGQRCTQA